MKNLNFDAPFPFTNSPKHKIFTALTCGTFVFFFLYVFQPFGIRDIVAHKIPFLLGYGMITAVSIAFGFFFLPLIIRQQIENWTIKKMLFFIVFQIIFISSINWGYHYYLELHYHEIFSSLQYYSLIEYFLITLSVGFFPTSLILFWLERQMLETNQEIAQHLDKIIQLNKKENVSYAQSTIVIGELPHNLKINPNELIAIKSDGNYAEIYLNQENRVNYKLIRCPLSTLQSQLNDFPSIDRCHRSYIVNFNNIEKITGNARNYNLHFEGLDFSIPVSRNYPAATIKQLKVKKR